MLFRAADSESKGCIFVEEFRLFLNKLKLGLSQAEINKLLHMFDEEWTGSIKRDDYLLCLAAYGVNSEKPNDKIRNLSHESLLRFARALIDKRYSSEDAFKNIDVKKTGAITSEMLSDFYKKTTPGVSKKERAALFFTMDLEQTGHIEKSRFIDLIEKATKVIHDKMNENTSGGFSTSMTATGGSNINERQGSNDKTKYLVIIDKFEKKINGPYTKLLESLVLSNKNPETGINFKQVTDSLSTFGDFLSFDEKFLIFRNLDINKNGNICFEDLIETFVEFKKPDSNYEFFIINLAKNLQALNVHTEAYLNENGITVDTRLDVEEFSKSFAGIINLFKEDCIKVFEAIVKGKKKIYGHEIINLINGYRSDVEERNVAKPTKKDDIGEEEEVGAGDQAMSSQIMSPSKTLAPGKTLTESATLKKSQVQSKSKLKQLDDDDKKFNKLIDVLKPTLENEDFFELDGKKMQTIFTNYLACLKK